LGSIPHIDNEVTGVTDDRYDERPDRPAWAVVPTMPWSRVQPTERRDDERGRYRVEDEPTHTPRRASPEAERQHDEPTERPRFEPPAPPPAAAAPAAPPAPESGEPVDPEQALAALRVSLDPDTLHEVPDNVYELFRIRDSLSKKIDASTDNASRARLLGLRAVVQRYLSELRPAMSDAKMALVHAEATGQLRRVAVAQSRLANVLVRLGEIAEADRLFTLANSPELPDRLRATIHHYAGKCAFTQDRYIEACQHFEKALELRRDGDPELVQATEVALDALFSRVAQRGWGPYPRTRDEILLTHKPPVPTFEERYDRWGYQNADGSWPIGPQFADVQPFREGVAWVRPVGIETWGLLAEDGRLLIDPRQGYLGVGSFSDDVAWVSRDGNGGWFAIDKANRVVIQSASTTYRPVPARHRDRAPARQVGARWRRTARLAVQFAFDAFATGHADGRVRGGLHRRGARESSEAGGPKGVIDPRRPGRRAAGLPDPRQSTGGFPVHRSQPPLGRDRATASCWCSRPRQPDGGHQRAGAVYWPDTRPAALI
jgi:tetratricopeptide (TPR) repeat protein